MNNIRRPVFISSIGLVSCIGSSLRTAFLNASKGANNFIQLSDDYSQLPCRIAGFVDQAETNKQIKNVCDVSEIRTMSRAAGFGLIASHQVLEDVGFHSGALPNELLARIGVSVGAGLEGIETIIETADSLRTKGYRRGIGPYTLTRTLGNMPASFISRRWQLKGPCLAANTACSTGLSAIGDAYRMIQQGEIDIALAGATEASISPWSIAAFSKIRALATNFNSKPNESSRPFDRDRNGFVMSEGAAVFLLHTLPLPDVFRHAPLRLNPVAEIVGFGRSCDAHHLVAPDPAGDGAFRSMLLAMREAREVTKESAKLALINCHATSTPLGDAIELSAIGRLLAEEPDLTDQLSSPICLNSFKGHLGHALGASGALELALCVQCMQENVVLPTANLAHPLSLESEVYPRLSEALGEQKASHILHLLTHHSKLPLSTQGAQPWPRDANLLLKNSFGFGGNNTSLALRRIQQ